MNTAASGILWKVHSHEVIGVKSEAPAGGAVVPTSTHKKILKRMYDCIFFTIMYNV